MNSGGNAVISHWRRLSVDVMIALGTSVIAFAAMGRMEDVPLVLLIPGALLGISLMLEPDVATQPG